MTATVLCAIAAIPAVLTIGLVRCRRALNLNQPTNKESNHE